MRWCPTHQMWEHEQEAAQPFGFASPLSVLTGMARTGAPVAMMPMGISAATQPPHATPAVPVSPSQALLAQRASSSPGYVAPQPAGTSTVLRATPASARAMPAGAREAASIPSGPPAWYTQAHDVIGSALLTATGTVASDPYAQNARDAFYLDRLTEFLRAWADDLQKRAAPLRKTLPFH